MAALTAGEKAEAETLLGPLEDDELVDIGERYGRWGSMGFAALELLMVRHSGMVSDPLIVRIEGDAQWDWRKNVTALAEKINALALMLQRETYPLSADQEKLLSRATSMASPAHAVTFVPYDVENKRLMSRRYGNR
jgi:hypothetical protein